MRAAEINPTGKEDDMDLDEFLAGANAGEKIPGGSEMMRFSAGMSQTALKITMNSTAAIMTRRKSAGCFLS